MSQKHYFYENRTTNGPTIFETVVLLANYKHKHMTQIIQDNIIIQHKYNKKIVDVSSSNTRYKTAHTDNTFRRIKLIYFGLETLTLEY